MSKEIQVHQPRLRLFITSKASEVMESRKENPRTSRAIIRAMEFTNGVTFLNPRTLMIENCPLGVHIDPGRGLVVVISKFQGFPAIPDELVEALLPFTTEVAVA
jgi:hypothetical protein